MKESELGRHLLLEKAATNRKWHREFHVIGVSDPSFTRICYDLAPGRGQAWCGADSPPARKPLVAPGELVMIGAADFVPAALFSFREGSSTPNLEVLDATPLSRETAAVVARWAHVYWSVSAEERSRADAALAEGLWWAENQFDPLVDRTTPIADFLVYLDALLEEVRADEGAQGYVSAGFLEDLLREREDSWPGVEQRARDSAYLREMLHGVWIDEETARRLPRYLRENVIVIG